jgi:hypothetical protein
MKASHLYVSAGLIALTSFSHLAAALDDGIPDIPTFSKCAWPTMMSPEGLGNYLGGPDGQARYWLTPFYNNYQTMEIEGHYPHARYFSLVVYDGDEHGLPRSTAGHLYDAIIEPDPDGIDSFPKAMSATQSAKHVGGSYTVEVTRDDETVGINVIHVTENHAWVMLRIYVPSTEESPSGLATLGGVPLPTIKLYGDGKDAPEILEPCPLNAPQPQQDFYPVRSINKLADVRALLQFFFPDDLVLNQASDYDDEPENGLIWLAPPWNPPMLLMPNPDNKYLVGMPGPYQKGRIIVIRAKAPTVPGKNGGTADMRYWSMCNTQLEAPIASVGCLSDRTAVTQGGWYTVVVSDDLIRPDWLPRTINWLPWGDGEYLKWFFFRNMIPVESEAQYDNKDLFPYAIQKVVAGCWLGKQDPEIGKTACDNPDAVVDFTFPDLPPRADITAAGPYVKAIMGEYYPVAVWCDKSAFKRGGWRACLND